jgi:hypothetical protein
MTRKDIPTLLLDNVKISNRMEVSAINAEGFIRQGMVNYGNQ